MTSTWWQHKRGELLWSIWIATATLLAMSAIIVITNGTRILPIAGACVVAVFLIYEVVQFDLHMRKKDQQ